MTGLSDDELVMKRIATTLVFFLMTISGWAQDYVIYSIAQEVPMGFENEKKIKNFYVNIGTEQGLRPGVRLNAYRNVVKMDTVESKKRYQHKVRVATLEVVHSEVNSSITVSTSTTNSREKQSESFALDIEEPMVGDTVVVKLD